MKYKLSGGYVTFDDEGIKLSNWFSKSDVHLYWSEVDFVCLTPGLKFKNGTWQQYNGEPIFKKNGKINLEFLQIRFVLHNLPKFLERPTWLQRRWMYSRYMIKQLMGVDDKPEKYEGQFIVDINPKLIASSIIELCELFQSKSRFDLVVSC